MAISKDKKQTIVAKLTDAFASASSIAFVSFSKLTVKDSSKLRSDLAEKGVQFYVAKKTLIRRALADRGFAGEIPELPGEVAIAWTEGEETTAPAGGVHEFAKKMKVALSLIGGVFEGAFLDKEKMTVIATIPPKGVLRGMFVNVINSPIQGLVVALDKIREKKGA